MAGYDGYSKSNNAVDAENHDRFPLTKAIKIVAAKTGITQKESRKVLKGIGTTEYHHTSKYYNCTDYYDIASAENVIDLARKLNLEINDSFIATFLANGLQDVDEPFEYLKNPPDEYSATIPEFVNDVNTDEWI